MKRDMDLIRAMVLGLQQGMRGDSLESHSEAALGRELHDGEFGYHGYLLVDAGLCDGIDDATLSDTYPQYALTHLTWAGQEFADLAANDTAWNRTVGTLKDKAFALSFAAVKAGLETATKVVVQQAMTAGFGP